MESAVRSLMFSWQGISGHRCLRITRQNLLSSHWKVMQKPARSRPRSNPPIPLKSEAARKLGRAAARLCAPFSREVPLPFSLALFDIVHKHRSDVMRLRQEAVKEFLIARQPLMSSPRRFARFEGAWIAEMDGRYLRVILLPDGETVHNAFFDRSFTP